MVKDGAFSYKIGSVTLFQEILNPEGHQNRITGSKVTATFLNGGILPVGGIAAGLLFYSLFTHFEFKYIILIAIMSHSFFYVYI